MTSQGWLYWGCLVVILVVLRLIPPSERLWAYDPGPTPGQHYPLWDHWSWWHLTVPGLLAAAPYVLGWSNAGVSALAGYIIVEGWERVEGYRSPQDVGFGVASIIGALGLALIVRGIYG